MQAVWPALIGVYPKVYNRDSKESAPQSSDSSCQHRETFECVFVLSNPVNSSKLSTVSACSLMRVMMLFFWDI